MKARQSKEASLRLAAKILEALQRGPRTVDNLADEFNFSEPAVRTRLRALLAEGRVHFVETRTHANLTVAHVWHIGAAPPVDQVAKIAPAREPIEERAAGPAEIPRQATVRVYQPINRRDALVAALFGPPGPGI